MFSRISISLFIIITNFTLAQNEAPVVENVNFNQRDDGSFVVDIHYDVNDPDGNSMTVSMEVSDDNGSTWNFTANNISGDVGEGITSGVGKHIIWDFGAEHPETFGDQFRVKILADDGVSDPGIPCPGIPTVPYAGKVYNTVQIGAQCWLKENLDVGTMIQSNSGSDNQTDNGTLEKYCYDNLEANCDIYGGLYQWNEAMQYTTTPGVKGICPDGWHIPTNTELQILATYVNNEAAKLVDVSQTATAFTPTNETGFSALFAGRRYRGNGSFSGLGSSSLFWSSTEADSYDAYRMNMFNSGNSVYFINYNKDASFSVRCLKD